MLSHFSRVWFFVTPWSVAHQAPQSIGFSNKNTGVGCRALLLGTFLTQELNLCHLHLLHWRLVLYHSPTWEAPKIAYSRPYSQADSHPCTNQAQPCSASEVRYVLGIMAVDKEGGLGKLKLALIVQQVKCWNPLTKQARLLKQKSSNISFSHILEH